MWGFEAKYMDWRTGAVTTKLIEVDTYGVGEEVSTADIWKIAIEKAMKFSVKEACEFTAIEFVYC